MIRIQILNTLVWNTVMTLNWEDSIPQQMQYIKSSYPSKRIRAINEEGQILDMIS